LRAIEGLTCHEKANPSTAAGSAAIDGFAGLAWALDRGRVRDAHGWQVGQPRPDNASLAHGIASD